jgi:hypothetical protein
MKTGEIVKWVVIILAIWLGFKYASRTLNSLTAPPSQATGSVNPGIPVWAPNYQAIGVWGPPNPFYGIGAQLPQGNPFYSSPEAPQPPDFGPPVFMVNW